MKIENILIFVRVYLITYATERLIVCPRYEVQLPGLKKSSKKGHIGKQEFLVYVTPQGKKKSTVIQCKGNGKAYIQKMYFDYCDISDVEIDFIKSICSFQSNSKLDDQIPALLKNILCGFLIQYHPECYAFFIYGRTVK